MQLNFPHTSVDIVFRHLGFVVLLPLISSTKCRIVNPLLYYQWINKIMETCVCNLFLCVYSHLTVIISWDWFHIVFRHLAFFVWLSTTHGLLNNCKSGFILLPLGNRYNSNICFSSIFLYLFTVCCFHYLEQYKLTSNLIIDLLKVNVYVTIYLSLGRPRSITPQS